MAQKSTEMTIIEHLDELRRRIIIVLAALTVGVVAAFIARDWVFTMIKRPIVRMEGVSADLVTLSPTEPFFTVVKVSVYAGFLIAIPIIAWQAWAFIMPALYEEEKKAVLPYVVVTTVLFLGGVVFGYYVVLPVGLAFLVGYGGDIFMQQLRAAEYISFVSLFLLGFGAVFELPAVMLLLYAAGIINYAVLARVRKYAVLVIAIITMILTPGDPVTMLLMMAPLYLLYEMSTLIIRLSERRRRRKQKNEAESAD